MITVPFVRTMARYNTWQNGNIFNAAAGLSDTQRKENRGAFFGSIHATLNHVLWADQMWLSRFGAAPVPQAKTIAEGLVQFPVWEPLLAARRHFDGVIENWSDTLEPEAILGDLSWFSPSMGRQVTHAKALLMTHVFNHQTHHRGQVHAMLTGFGIKPGATDLPFGPAGVYAA